MKKRVKAAVLASLCCLMGFWANSQVIMSLIFGDKLNSEKTNFGIHLNYAWNQIQGMEDGKALKSFNLGLFFNYHFNEHWFGNVDMLAKYTRGEDKLPPYLLANDTLNSQFSQGQYQRKINYVSLPLSIQYVSSIGIFAELGPQVSFRAKAKDIFTADSPEGTLKLEKDIRDDVHRWDIGWLAGIGYKIGKDRSLTAGLRYQAGFSDVLKNVPGNQSHRQWGVYVNMPVGKKKAASKDKNSPGT